MHDPMTVAFEIRRPWPSRSSLPAAGSGDVRWRIRLHHSHHDDCAPNGCTGNPFPWWKPRSYSSFWRLAGRDFYWPPMVTVWHVEPGGADGLSVCGYRRDADGKKRYTKAWHWHVHHWRLRFPPLQHLRRWLLTRCAGCGGKSRKGRMVNVSLSWDGPRGHWWQGEPGLYHVECTP